MRETILNRNGLGYLFFRGAPHTHKYIATGTIDSKFGFPLSSSEEAVAAARSEPNLNLVGLHFHIGSLIFEIEPYA
ncbi:MAG: diaminopimelate decarboxylase, partial [Candidatus Omnitrophica bacterium]|nr:diaminopimelate decarboxylase [Candidatus Omnitrophota bacterium]